VFALASWQKRIALGFCRRVTGKRAKICGRARGQVMKPIRLVGWAICACLALAGCGDGKSDPKAEAPPALKVQSAADENVFEADRPEQFALVTAGQHMAAWQLRVTGTVAPDVSRSVPVISVATGRVVTINARLGDTVKKGQVLLRLQSADLSGAFSDYRKGLRMNSWLARKRRALGTSMKRALSL